ncbi:MAG: glycerol kinase GlpK [Candidatus Onthovivens sp.]|nr:glycerol kinase GlpK [Candidatus Onthovivens sp.]MDY4936857.1 glycerol kinase GlpK [Candidatus Onthovivens sp.]
MKYILAIDQGTTSSRALIFNKFGKVEFKSQMEIECLFPKEGWVEQNALDVWVSVINVINDALAKMNITVDDIYAIGITNQRETTVIWDKKTGLPVYNAIVWQSRQSASICEEWEPYKKLIHKKTGLILNPYFSASKIRFILNHIENGQQRAENGELMFGTIDTWLMYKLSKGKIFKTDVSNASRTMLFNINTLQYDNELLKLFNIPKKMLPKVEESYAYFGDATFFKKGIRINGVAGDQQAALFGQNCFDAGQSKSTYGTGCFMLLNTGNKPIFSENGILTTIAWKLNGETKYALEGSVFMGGACVQWLRDQLKLVKESGETEKCAINAKTDLGVYVVPAFVGLGAPYWDDNCKGAIFGLTRGTTKDHLIRATLNAIAYQVKDVMEVMQKDGNIHIDELKVDGGATNNKYLMQFQADILQTKILLPSTSETTALGVAYLAGLGSKYWLSLDEIKKIHQYKDTYVPKMSKEEVDKKYEVWKKAVAATRTFR